MRQSYLPQLHRTWMTVSCRSRDAGNGAMVSGQRRRISVAQPACGRHMTTRSEEHTSELQSLMRISYAVFCLKKKKSHLMTTLTNTLLVYIHLSTIIIDNY